MMCQYIYKQQTALEVAQASLISVVMRGEGGGKTATPLSALNTDHHLHQRMIYTWCSTDAHTDTRSDKLANTGSIQVSTEIIIGSVMHI